MKKRTKHPLDKWAKVPSPKVARVKAKATEEDVEHLTSLGKKVFPGGEFRSSKTVHTGRAGRD